MQAIGDVPKSERGQVMKTAYAILIFNLLLCVAFFFEHWIAGVILTSIWLLSAIGLVGFHNSRNKFFAYTAYAGFAPFFPIGLLAVLGIRRQLEILNETPCPTNPPIKIFRFSRKLLNGYLIIGGCAIIAEVLTQYYVHYPSIMGALGLGLIISSFALRKTDLLKVYPDYFTYKPSPLMNEKIVRFCYLEKVIKEKKKLVLKIENEERLLKIRLNSFDPSDRQELETIITENQGCDKV